MRAARLLRILLLLQNRGRLTSAQLAAELEVAPRTILRDADALTEAGLPVIVRQGHQGGIELGFNYRTRLTGLATDEAEALGVLLAQPAPALAALGMGDAAARAGAKLVESLPDAARASVETARRRFRFEAAPIEVPDPRIAALAEAIRRSAIVTIRAGSDAAAQIHPVALRCGPEGWQVIDARSSYPPIRLADCGDITISAKTFTR